MHGGEVFIHNRVEEIAIQAGLKPLMQFGKI